MAPQEQVVQKSIVLEIYLDILSAIMLEEISRRLYTVNTQKYNTQDKMGRKAHRLVAHR